jgi:hypothetical protein
VTNFRTAYVGVFSLFVAALCLFAFRRFPRFVVVVMMLFSVVCFVGGSRGVAGVHAVAGVLTYYYYRLARRRRNQGLAAPIPWAWRVRSLLALATAGVAVVWGYGYAAPRGWIGEAARLRYEEKAASALGLLAARGEVFGGVLALIDSPIIGYGSWAADTNGYRARAWELIGFPNVRVSSEVMPGHSHVVSSWVAHGLWGGVFWVYVIYLLFRFILRYLPGRPEYLPYSTLTAIGLLWSIFASPFGARPATAAGLVFLVVAGEQAQRLLRQGARNGQAGSGATNGGGQHPAPPPGQPETVAAASK